MTLGDVLNKQVVTDVMVNNVADNVAIAAGKLVYQDGANGLKVVPTSSQPQHTRIRFLEKAVDNTIVGHVLGLIKGETYKRGAQVVGTADGAIVVGTYVKASTNVAGAFMQATVPAAITGGDAPTEAEFNTLQALIRDGFLGIYKGHIGQGKETGSEPTDAADTETNIVVEML